MRLLMSGDRAVLHARTRGVIEAVLADAGEGRSDFHLADCPVVVVTHHAPYLSHLTDSGRIVL